jgi:hypothetical protein
MATRALARLTCLAVVLASGCSPSSETEPESSKEPRVATAAISFDDAIDVRGRIVDSMTHEPVPGAWIVDRFRPSAERFPTKDDGTFEARIRPSTLDDRFDIGIFAEHYCWIHQTWSREELERSLPLEIDLPLSGIRTGSPSPISW